MTINVLRPYCTLHCMVTKELVIVWIQIEKETTMKTTKLIGKKERSIVYPQ